MRPGEHEARWAFYFHCNSQKKKPRLAGAGAKSRDDHQISSLEEKLSQLRLLADVRLVPLRIDVAEQ
jgi:hypothetical protein